MRCLKNQHQTYFCRRILNRKSKKVLISIGSFLILFYLMNHVMTKFKSNYQIKSTSSSSSSIGLFIVSNDDFINDHKQHTASLACYAKRHSYRFILIHPKQYPFCLNMTQSIYFQKHCLVLMYLLENSHIDWLLVLDIDVLVLNISKKIEHYLPKPNVESSIHMIFYERFNGEIAAGNYIIHNRPWAHAFIFRWLEYERRIVNIKFHNSDNGALHMHLLGNMVGKVSQSKYDRCFQIYEKVTEPIVYHSYVGCCKCALDGRWEFDHLRILRRGHSFVRDNLGHTNEKRIWSPTDFLLHGQKKNLDLYYSSEIDTYKCASSTWVLPLRDDAIMKNYTQVKETISKLDREAAHAYPQSVGLPDISECWPYCNDTKTRRQAFLEKVCNKNASWRSL